MPFSIHDLAQHSGAPLRILEMLSERLPSGAGYLFQVKSFRKKRGGLREVVKPNSLFDMVTKNLHRSFSMVLPYRPPDHVHGFVSKRSTLTNASVHLGKACVLRVDLEDFFPSISSTHVKSVLQEQGYDEKAANLAVSIVTIAGKLPIGLSTSPFLSNLAFQETDRVLAAYSTAKNLSFTRYVDDLAFSGEVTDRHLADIEQILNDAGWSINTSKTAFMRRGGPQYVTGLYVGTADRPRIPREIKRHMRWTSHVVSKFGYETYMTEFGGEDADMLPQRLLGWARYIAAVEPDLGYSLLRIFHEEVPEQYVSRRDIEWLMQADDLD
ncbi:reverse transcriptase family protein [Micromonospora echinaurantiaca]|uniref:reverse transcriptase family protein n=1 Tax=Micromonospora echinaurantiaca TaxID=47857 RepID=UPI0037118B44